MAQPNGYYTVKGFREDILEVDGAYTVEPHLYECGNFVNKPGATATITLPPALPGRTHTFHVSSAHTVTITPANGETLSTDAGKSGAANKSASNSTAGSSITYTCIEAGHWNTEKAVGTWPVA